MNKFEVIYTIKGILLVFKDVVEAESVEQARALIKKLVRDNGMKLDHITAVIQIN